jgi:hypothetical protein
MVLACRCVVRAQRDYLAVSRWQSAWRRFGMLPSSNADPGDLRTQQEHAYMGLMDVLDSMQKGSRGQQPPASAGSGGMSPISCKR